MQGPAPVSDSTKKILQNMMAAESIFLKLNAQVMLIKNMDDTLVNGSMGKVIGFCEKHLYREDAQGRWAGEVMPEDSDGDDSVGEDGAPKKKRKTSTGPKPQNDKRREILPVVAFRIPGGESRRATCAASLLRLNRCPDQAPCEKSSLKRTLSRPSYRTERSKRHAFNFPSF